MVVLFIIKISDSKKKAWKLRENGVELPLFVYNYLKFVKKNYYPYFIITILKKY